MFANILVAHDGTDCSDVAFEYALMLAKKFGGKLTVCHVTNYAAATFAIAGPGAASEFAIDAIDSQKAKIDAQLRTRLAACGVKSTLVEVTDRESNGILETARTAACDLVVVGSHHKSWLEKLFDPSVSARVAAGVHVPILVVPQGSPARS